MPEEKKKLRRKRKIPVQSTVLVPSRPPNRKRTFKQTELLSVWDLQPKELVKKVGRKATEHYKYLVDLCSNTLAEDKPPFVPKPEKERSKIRMLPFQKKKIVKLMYGDQVLDLENPKAMKREMTIRKVSSIVGV